MDGWTVNILTACLRNINWNSTVENVSTWSNFYGYKDRRKTHTYST